MKRTFTYLLLLVLLVCGKQAYNLLISNESIRSNPTGALSDIADEVIAIPLRDAFDQGGQVYPSRGRQPIPYQQ
jgi:hypothetical protein